MATPKQTVVEEELDDKTKRDREEVRKRRLERSLEPRSRGQLSRFRSDQRHPAGPDPPEAKITSRPVKAAATLGQRHPLAIAAEIARSF
jgi:hypothetical protein